MDYIEKQAIAERMTWIKEFGYNVAKAYDEINCNDPEHYDLNRENGTSTGIPQWGQCSTWAVLPQRSIT